MKTSALKVITEKESNLMKELKNAEHVVVLLKLMIVTMLRMGYQNEHFATRVAMCVYQVSFLLGTETNRHSYKCGVVNK
jgi:hypothetical protein